MKTVALVPIKMNNERTPGKNTKLFSDGTPLIHCVLRSLLQAKEVDEIYVYCSKEEIKKYLLDGIKYLKRDEKFDTATTSMNEILYAFSQEVYADVYALVHCTAPFQDAEKIDAAIKSVKSGEFDSALAVKKMQEFLWVNGKPFNYDTCNIPRTQDLEPIYVETNGMYVFTRRVITERKRRVGDCPYLLEVSEIEALDIDNPIDFEIANAINEIILHKH